MSTLINQIRHFHQSRITAQLHDSMRQKSLLDIWDAGRKENGHSNFLAWLMAPEESHDLGTFALQKLLLLLVSCSHAQEKQLPEELLHAILAGVNIIRCAKVGREVPIPPNGRVDIVATIELAQELAGFRRLQIVLENKIDASETNDQTIRYYQHFSAGADPQTYPVFVYLTPTHAQPCQDPHFIHIDYQQILDTLLTPALQRQNLSQNTRRLLEEYVHLLSCFNEKNQFIAMNEEQRKLLIKFWEENSTLILACAQAISEDPDASQDVQESARSIVEQGKKVNRDRTKYICKDSEGRSSEPMGKGRMVLYVVKRYAEINDCTYSRLQEAFSPKWFKEAKDINVEEKPKRYFLGEGELITLSSGEEIAVSNQCGGETSFINFGDFKKKAEEVGFQIIEQEH